MSNVTVADLQKKVGQEIGVSDWVLVDQAMIDKFAEATGDHQYIHVDPERAKSSPFGGTIAHGFLTLALMPQLIYKTENIRPSDIKMGLNYGGNKVRFLTPLPSGKRVRGRFKLLELDEKRPNQFQQTVEFTVEIEGMEKPALVAEWITQFFT